MTLNHSLIVLYLFIYYYISICVLDAPKVNKILSTSLLSILLTYLVLYSYAKYSRRIQTLNFSERTKWVIPGLARIARYQVVIHRMLRSRRSFTLISLVTARCEYFLLIYFLNPFCLYRLARSPEREDCVAVPSQVT